MLYLTRKVGESIVINDDIEITVVEIRGRSIKLGLTFPADATVYRREVHDRILAERRAAAGAAAAREPAIACADAAPPAADGKLRKTGTG